MSNIFFILMICASLAVLGSLAIGVYSMARGGEASKKYSNKMMKARVILQGIALLLFMLAMITAKT